MKRKLLIAVPLLCLVTFTAWMLRPKHESQGEAFVSEKTAPMLSTIAQVRQQVGTLHYGDRVEVVSKRNEYIRVRTNAGLVGWVDSRQLMEPALWQRSLKLLGIAREGGADRDLVPERTHPRLIVWAQPRKKLCRSCSEQLQVALHTAGDIQHDDQPDRLR